MDDWQNFQEQGKAFAFKRPGSGTERRALGGLGFQLAVSDEQWPMLQKPNWGSVSARKNEGGDNLYNQGIGAKTDLLGEIGVSGNPGRLLGSGGDWSHKFLYFQDALNPVVERVDADGTRLSELTVCVGRLSPAILARSLTGSITLFKTTGPMQGVKKGRGFIDGAQGMGCFAFPEADGSIHTGSFRPQSGAAGVSPATERLEWVDAGWMLFWNDPDMPLRSSRLPKDLMAYIHYYSNQSHVQDDPIFKPPFSLYGGHAVLVVFQNPPSSVEFDVVNGVTFTFEPMESGGAPDTGWIAMVLPDERFPLVSDTGEWLRNGLPGDLIEKCRWWARHLERYPKSVRESFSIDDSGNPRVRQQFEFIDIADAPSRYAPLPTTVALALETGLPVGLPAKPAKSGAIAYCGPYHVLDGVDEYEYEIAGLEKYIAERRLVEDAPLSERARKMLMKVRAETGKALDAGHLSPWLIHDNLAVYPSHPLWSYPGDGLYFMSEMAPLLDESGRSRLIEWLREERGCFPPEEMRLLPYGVGAMRPRYREHEGWFAWVKQTQDVSKHPMNTMLDAMPLDGLYHLSRYYDTVGHDELKALSDEEWGGIAAMAGPWLARTEWNTGVFYRELPEQAASLHWMWPWYYVNTGCVMLNRMFAGWLGLARMAEIRGDAETRALASGMFARTAAARHAAEKFTPYLYSHDCQALPDWQPLVRDMERPGSSFEGIHFSGLTRVRRPSDDIRLPFRFDDIQTQLEFQGDHYNWSWACRYADMVPELGRFFGDFCREEGGRVVAAYASGAPEHYLTLTEDLFARESFLELPMTGYQMFMARLWILGQAPEQAERFLDIPWLRLGDFYHMHKMAELVKAELGVKWARQKR